MNTSVDGDLIFKSLLHLKLKVMLIEVNDKTYRRQFLNDPIPYISKPYIELVQGKVDRVVNLMEDNEKVCIGLVAGIKNDVLLSPFSAPFGGFHFRHNNIFISEIDHFINQLVDYASLQHIEKIKLSLPPDIYHHSFNTKMANALLRNGFSMDLPEITNWINLHQFKGEFSCRNARQNYNKSLQYNLSFHLTHDPDEKEEIYRVIYENRKKLGRPIYVTLDDLHSISKMWPVDFFQVSNPKGQAIAGAIFYRGHEKIVQGIFWGDSEHGRCFRAMDFCAFNLWKHYKALNYDIIDLGASSLCGEPSDGLIRFKEDHDCTSALRLCFNLNLKQKIAVRKLNIVATMASVV